VKDIDTKPTCHAVENAAFGVTRDILKTLSEILLHLMDWWQVLFRSLSNLGGDVD